MGGPGKNEFTCYIGDKFFKRGDCGKNGWCVGRANLEHETTEEICSKGTPSQ